MHLFEKRPVFRVRGLVITLIIFIAVVALFGSLMNRTGQTADREQETLLQRALLSAAVTHYAIEGAYPATLDQIVEVYGIVVDEERFYVDYGIFASNIMPSIGVTARQ